MTVEVSRQALDFAAFWGLGLALGLCYDLGRALRREHPALTVPVDFLFGLLFFLSVWVLSLYTYGLRLYLCLGVFLGAALYFLTLSAPLLRLFRRGLQGLGRLGRKILQPLKKSGDFLRKHAKKLFSSLGKSVTIKAIPFSLSRSPSREKRP